MDHGVFGSKVNFFLSHIVSSEFQCHLQIGYYGIQEQGTRDI